MLIFLLLGSGPLLDARAETSSDKLLEPGEDLEVLLDTLNETLTENLRLEQQLENKDEEMKQIMAQGNVLRGEIRRLERERDRRVRLERNRTTTITQNLEERTKELTEVKNHLETLEQEMKEIDSERVMLEEKNHSLEELLDQAILQEEADEYRSLLEQAKNSSAEALQKVTSVMKEREQMKVELADLHFSLGNVATNAREFEKAVVHYQKALELNPSDPETHHNLGIIFDYYIPDPDRALHHYRNYLQIMPLDEAANKIRERVLELRIRKSIIPGEPLKKEFYRYQHNAN